MDLAEIKRLVVDQGRSIEEWRAGETKRIDELKSQFDEFVLRSQRPGIAGRADGTAMGDAERKATETAIRAWVRGDQAAVDNATAELKAMSVGSAVDGGYAVIAARGAMVRVMAEVSPLIGAVRSINLSTGDALEGIVDNDSAGATWVGETEARPDTTTPQIGAYRIPLHEIYAMPKISQKLIDVADIDVVGWAQSKIAEAFAVALEDAIVAGDGVAKPRGLITYPTSDAADSSRAWGTFEHVDTGANGDFHTTKADPLIDLVAALRPVYRSRARWVMSRAVAAKIRKMKVASSDEYLWQPGLQSGNPDTLLGFPILYCEAMPALDTGSLSVAFGDFASAYWSVARPGVKLLTDLYTDKPNVRLYAYHRMGGGAVNFEAVKFLRFAA
ncbi:MAG: phage major capsid protein [Burkholderiaceae bacterium]|nr:phage major capsid protein [Burkholderiaceae bacterium]